MNADLDARYQRDAALLQAAKSLGQNKGFLLLFLICFLVGAVGLLTVGVSGMWGLITVAVLLAVGGVGAVTGKMEEMMTLGVAAIAGLSGIVCMIVAVYVLAGIR